MRNLKSLAGACLFLPLAACGGGGGGGGPQPAPPPPPPPPAQTNSTLTNLQFSETFTNAGASLSATLAKPSGTSSDVAGGASQVTVAYDAPSQTYTITAGGRSSTFGPSNRNAAASNATITVYERESGSISDAFVLFNPGAGNPALSLTYASYGAWQRITDSTNSLAFRQDFFVYGIPTVAADMPRTGTASYQSYVDGVWTDNVGTYSIGGTGGFTADFASGAVSTNVSLTGQNILTGGARAFGTVTGSGQIAANTNSFSMPLTGGTGYSGTMNGLFFGPQAAEVGGAFSLSNGAGGAITAALVGRKN